MEKNIIIVCAGGHAKVIIDIIRKRNIYLNEKNNIVSIYDDKYNQNKNEKIFDVPIIGKISDLLNKDLTCFF